jgi:patatin-like phospholipase/acyl hydrolase
MTASRDDHLFGPGPKRILALDGGGTRGIIELAFLARIEALLRAAHDDDPDFRLADWFDLIGGTSTGAIIAAGLAMGKPVEELTRIYLDLSPLAFRRRRWRLTGLVPRFDAAPLTRVLQTHFGERTLDTPDLRTGFAVVARRFDTGSPWLISNDPRAPYWADPADAGFIGNCHYRLVEVVRASSAAPGLFRPQWIQVVPGRPPGLFVDGGFSPHNNPSLMLLMLLLMLTQARVQAAMGTRAGPAAADFDRRRASSPRAGGGGVAAEHLGRPGMACVDGRFKRHADADIGLAAMVQRACAELADQHRGRRSQW